MWAVVPCLGGEIAETLAGGVRVMHTYSSRNDLPCWWEARVHGFNEAEPTRHDLPLGGNSEALICALL